MTPPSDDPVALTNPLDADDDFRLEPTFADAQCAFGQVLREARERAGLTHAEFALLTGMTTEDLHRGEECLQVPAYSTLPRIIDLSVWLHCPDLVAAFHASHQELARQRHSAFHRGTLPAPGSGFLPRLPHLHALDITLFPAPRP